MNDRPTVEQLAAECAEARRRIAELEAAATLRSSVETRYHALLDGLGDAVYVYELTGDRPGRLLDANRCATEMLGYARDELLAMDVSDLDVPEQAGRAAAIAQELRSAGASVFTTEHLAKDGRRVAVEVSARLVELDGRPTVLSVVRDLSPRLAAQDQIARLQDLLNGAERLGNLGGWEYDVASERGVWTDEVHRIHGLEPGNEPELDEALAFYVPEHRPLIAEAFRRAMDEGEPYDLEAQIERADGRRVWVRTIGRPELADGAVARVRGNIMDITERKLAEEQLRAREEQYRALVENLDEVLVRYDLDLRYRYVSPSMVRVTGMHPEDLIGKTHRESGFPESLSALFDETLRRAVDTRHTVELEFESVGADGRPMVAEARVYPEFDAEGRPVSVVTITRDVTEHRRADDALRASEAMRTTAERIARVGSWRFDLATREVSWSPGMYALFGLDGREDDAGLDKALPANVHPDDRAAVERATAEATASGRPAPIEFRVVWPDGSLHLLHGDGGAERDASGEIVAFTGYYQDVTEQRAVEAEIRRLNEELRQRVVDRTEQLDASTRELEALAYSIAHDVRAPLRTIDGFSAAVMEDEGDALSDEAIASLQRVRSAAQTLARLLDDLTGLSRASQRELVRQTLSLSDLAVEVGRELDTEHPGRSVVLTVSPGVTAAADPMLTRIILRELLGNAWKFTAHRETAHVEVGALDMETGERAFYVRDDGAGFDTRYAEHLFGVFQRMHPAGEYAGDGVGLAMVQRLVRRHGGRCWAEAEVERGATFFFTLPPEASGA